MFQGKVKLNRHQLNYFRKRSRDSEKEILAVLVGEVVSPALTRVDYFWYPEYAEQTANCVQATIKSLEELKHKSDTLNLKIVGSIHSHPDWVPILSPADYKGHIEDGDRISGIVGINGRQTRVYFWTIESALPLTVEYI